MTSLLLSTKFYIPSVRAPLVQRDRLIQQLNRGIDSKLILISATAGFGKTTLLSEWLHQLKRPVSWLSLDKEDNNLVRFWTYLVAALQQIDSKIGQATLTMLHSMESVSFESFLIPLLNELAQFQQDCLLVLDDYHVISVCPIHEALTFFLEHLPPHVHLAIASRIDPPLPLARLRGRGQLTELKATNLRFTVAEAAIFVKQSMAQSLSQEQLEAIQTKTEGWIAGLQLAVLSMRDTKDISTFIDSLKGSQRYIVDYLVEEVLEHQPKFLQSFLLRTSILEQMCGSLCEAVVGEDNGTEILEQLERSNLFIVPLDRDRHWYRYHHLFGELLRHRLQRLEPEQVPEYHRRAAKWYEQQGFVTETIQHAIAADEFLWAAEAIEYEAQRTNPRIEPSILLKCLEALPSEIVWTRPWLLLGYAWALFSSSQFEAAAKTIKKLEDLLQQKQNHSTHLEKLWGLVTALKGMQARQQGAIAESVVLMEKALSQLPQENSWLRAMVLLNLGVTYFVADNFVAAKKLLPQVSQIGRVRGMADPAIAGLYLQAQFLALRGRLDRAIALCEEGLELAKQRGWLATYAGVLVQVALGELLREQNQLEAAAQHLCKSIERGIETRQPGVMMGYITLARVHQGQGNLQAAWEAIQAAEQCRPWLWSTILSVGACKTRLYLAQGQLEDAISWVEDRGLNIEDELCYSAELDYLTFARVLIACGRSAKGSKSHLDDVLQLLDRLYDFVKMGGRKTRVMEVLMLQALAWQARGDLEHAIDSLDRALSIPRRGDYIRLFIDEGKPMIELLRYAASKRIHAQSVNRLLAAWDIVTQKTDATVRALLEPLSDREKEVLQHLATGHTNQAIANKLYISLAAVKWHAGNIYGKMNVHNRTQAVAKARELGILT